MRRPIYNFADAKLVEPADESQLHVGPALTDFSCQRHVDRYASGFLFGDSSGLEWATPSPPPAFNFPVLPNIRGEEAYWGMKQRALAQARLGEEPLYADVEMPRNSPTGFICAFFATFMGFALIWHIWWLVGVAALGAYATFVVFAWRDKDEYVIPAAVR